MPDIHLTQSEADALLYCDKEKTDDDIHLFPGPGERKAIPLQSKDRRETFILDIARGTIKLTKATYQNRARNVVVLARLDVDGPPHTNPDGVDVPCPHLHLYREGFGTKWAEPANISHFPSTSDIWQTLHDFLSFCKVVDPPQVQKSLF